MTDHTTPAHEYSLRLARDLFKCRTEQIEAREVLAAGCNQRETKRIKQWLLDSFAEDIIISYPRVSA